MSRAPVSLPDGFPRPAGAYSPAMRAGNLLFVSGQVPRHPLTGKVDGSDIQSQSKRVLENLKLVLEAAGATLADVVSVTVYLANIDDWAAFNDVYRATMPTPFPSRTVVGAQLRGVMVEINAIATVTE